jgi:fructose-1,6-bisphosphatase/inositol monophosphatase family enzyme
MPTSLSSLLHPHERAFAARLLNEHTLESLILDMLETVRAAGETILKPNFGKASAQTKVAFGEHEPVTEVDRAISTLILNAVRASLPGSYSEEEMPADADERRRESLLWQLDPLDGTQEFIEGYSSGVAIQGALLARLDGAYLPVAGIIHRPAHDSLWFTDQRFHVHWELKGKAQPLPSYQQDGTVRGLVRRVTPDPALDATYERVAAALGEKCELVQSGGAGSMFGDLLEGRANLMICKPDLSKAWDVSMAIPLLTARGGFICDLDGNDFSDLNGQELRNRQGFIASILYRKQQILSALSKAPRPSPHRH